MTDTKMWGSEEFWGLGFEYDPQWLLTPAQQELQAKLIKLELYPKVGDAMTIPESW